MNCNLKLALDRNSQRCVSDHNFSSVCWQSGYPAAIIFHYNEAKKIIPCTMKWRKVIPLIVFCLILWARSGYIFPLFNSLYAAIKPRKYNKGKNNKSSWAMVMIFFFFLLYKWRYKVPFFHNAYNSRVQYVDKSRKNESCPSLSIV